MYCTMYTESRNIETMMSKETDNIIEKLHKSLLQILKKI